MANYSEAGLQIALGGLERLMTGTKPKGVLDHGGTVPKIASIIYYQSSVISEVIKSNSLKSKYVNAMFDQINKDFGQYIDMQARNKPKELHHVYEWGRVGTPISRLFKIKKVSSDDFNLTFGIEMRQSRTSVPNKFSKKYVFKNKAFVMESGRPVTITPRQSNRLVFEINGEVIFMKPGKSVKVKSPGGPMARGSLERHYKKFVSGGLLQSSIEKSGATKMVKSVIFKAMKIPTLLRGPGYSYSPSTVRNLASAAVNANVGI